MATVTTGFVLSIFVKFPVAVAPKFVPSHSLAYIIPLLLYVCVALLSHVFPSLLVCSVYPVTVVLAVAVTSVFVHPLGLYANFTFALVKSVPFPVAVYLLALIFPAWSFTHT